MRMPLQDVRVRGLLGTTRLCLSFIEQLQSEQEVRVNLSESKHSSNSCWLHSYCGLTIRHHAEHSPEDEVKVHQHHPTLVTSDAMGQSPLAVNSRTRFQEKHSALASSISCQPKVHFQTYSETPSLNAVQLLPSWKQHLLVYIMLAHACMHLYKHTQQNMTYHKRWGGLEGDNMDKWLRTILISDLRQYLYPTIHIHKYHSSPTVSAHNRNDRP